MKGNINMQKQKRITLNSEKRTAIANVFQSHFEREDSPVIKKYNKTIRRIGTLNKEGCRTWEDYKGNKLMCFWDPVINRYTPCINPVITYKNKRN